MDDEEATEEEKRASEERSREFNLRMERGIAFGSKMKKMDINQLKADIPANWGVDDTIGWGWDTPFAYCAYLGWEEGMRYLHSIDANVNKTDHDDCTVLMYPLYPLRIVRLAVELGVNVLYSNCHVDTCLTIREHYPRPVGSDNHAIWVYLQEVVQEARKKKLVLNKHE